MSSEKRRITHYSLEMVTGAQYKFDAELFRNFIYALMEKPREERIENLQKQNKALLISSVDEYHTRDGMIVLNIVFCSCKYNHAPDYMSSTNGEERATTKHKDEGEEEATHFAVKLTTSEGYIVFEERRTGVSIGNVVKYLSKYFRIYQNQQQMKPICKLEYSIVPQDDFLEMLGKCTKVCSAELFVGKELLGSDFLNIAKVPLSLKNELVIYMAAERGKSIDTEFITKALDKVMGGTANRIRIRVKDENGSYSVLDTHYGKRKNEVLVDLNENGTVNSKSMFSALREVLTGDEEE